MAKEVVVLTTCWSDDYWHKPKEAKYTGKVRYSSLPDWDRLASQCPLAGLGVYSKDKETVPFVYLRIQGMRYDPQTGNPFFTFVPIEASSTPSSLLRGRLPSHCRRLVSEIPVDELLPILEAIGEKPPREWLNLLEGRGAIPTWRSWLGEYFRSLEETELSNAEFEDGIASLLRAIGFVVDQKGHTSPGACADGIAIHEDFGLVYDCKNSGEYVPLQEHIRALRQYVTDERELRPQLKLYPAFIAKSFAAPAQENIFQVSVAHLLRLLFARLNKGPEFNLRPLKLILDRNIRLDDSVISQYWEV